MFCKKCGNELKNGDKFCRKCGTQRSVSNDNTVTNNELHDIKKKIQDTNHFSAPNIREQKSSDNVVVNPVNGSTIEEHLVRKEGISGAQINENRSNMSHGIKYIFFSLIILCIFWGAKHIVNYNSVSHGTEPSSQESSSQESSNQESNSTYQSIYFDTEQQIRSYLLSHKFQSDDGYTMSFQNNANEIYLNGRCMTSSISIQRYGRQGAFLKGSGPYGLSTFTLTVQDGAHGLLDMSDETAYNEIE